jgi:hypothetical protein
MCLTTASLPASHIGQLTIDLPPKTGPPIMRVLEVGAMLGGG